MKRKTVMLFVLGVLAILLISGIAAAQSGILQGRSVIAGGGGSLANGNYDLTGTIGQAVAGQPLQNGAYGLSAGFWQAGAVGGSHRIYLPLTTK